MKRELINSLTAKYQIELESQQVPKPTSNTYTNALSGDFHLQASLYDLTNKLFTDQVLVIASPTDVPSVCLVSLPSFHGDVACFGLGGGRLPATVKGKGAECELSRGCECVVVCAGVWKCG